MGSLADECGFHNLRNILGVCIGIFKQFEYLADSFYCIYSICVIEGGVLMLMKRSAARQNWIVSLIANLASYLLIILPSYIWPQHLRLIAKFLGI